MKVVEVGIRFSQFQLVRLDYLTKHGLSITALEILPSRESQFWHRDSGKVNIEVVTLCSPSFLKTWRTLSRLAPDVLLVDGYYLPQLRAAMIWGKIHRVLTILQSETAVQDKVRFTMKELIKKWFLKLFVNRFIAANVGAGEYLKHLGVPSTKLHYVDLQCADIEHYRLYKDTVRKCDPDRSVGKAMLPERFFVFVGRLDPIKNIDLLLTAYASYRRVVGSMAWDLVIVGQGLLEKHLKQRILAEGIEGIVFTGPLSYDDTARVYALASCFVLASLVEPSGMVIAEAAASSLPLILTCRAGHLEKYLIDGLNGGSFNPQSVQELTSLLIDATTKWDLKSMGEASFELASRHSPGTYALEMASLLKSWMGRDAINAA